MRRLTLLFLFTVPAFGQDLFPRFSITAGTSAAEFETNARIDPEGTGEAAGDALTGNARLEYRPLRWLGIGAAYHYFRLNVDVAQTGELHGSLDMAIQGPEAFLRLAF
jgi:hypothetical protein